MNRLDFVSYNLKNINFILKSMFYNTFFDINTFFLAKYLHV